ncbi:MAG TPA: DUF1566 domain-containing protein [bacterium]|nr:DUF1566 domain-containing protein [bacterium]
MKKLDDENLLGLIKSKETCPPDELAAAMEEISLRKLMPENEIQLIKDCNEKKWYYEKSGKRNGPVTTFQISVLIKDETISFTTSVWKKDFENWKPISETELKQYFKIEVPPPLLGDKVNNTFIWLLAFAPIFGTIIEGLFFQEVSFKRTMIFWTVLNSGLAIIDDLNLKKAGHKTNNIGWAIFFVPVYIWRRASLTHQSKSYFWVWVVAVIASIFIDPAAQEFGKQLEVRKNVQQLFEKVWSPSVSWSEKSNNDMDWNDAKIYCDNLEEDGYSDWRLPTISELRTLIKNCPATETGGECGATDSCLSSDCRNDPCGGCEEDETGKYSKLGDTEWLWSSSEPSDIAEFAWVVHFGYGNVLYNFYKYNNINVRCLR